MTSSGSTPPGKAVPNSSGTNRPQTPVPANACDAHIHIFDTKFGPPHASTDDYRLLQQRIGTSRTVIVTPREYVTDNSVTLDAISRLGRANTRGIGVVHPQVTDAQLRAMNAGGIRGIRFSLHNPVGGATSFDMLEPLAQRVDELGWHFQLHLGPDQIVAHSDMLLKLPCTIVFDHMARLTQPNGTAHPAFGVINRLLDGGRTWVKLSGTFVDEQHGKLFSDTVEMGRAFVRAAPERLVWGSDWPHITDPVDKPNDADRLDLLAEWAPDQAVRQRILVDNPQSLYEF